MSKKPMPIVRDGVADRVPDYVEPVANHLLQQAYLDRLAIDLAALEQAPSVVTLVDILEACYRLADKTMGISERRLDEIRISRIHFLGTFSRFVYKGAEIEKLETSAAPQGMDEALVAAAKAG